MTAKLKTLTLGCKVNQYETQFVRDGLTSIGFQDAMQEESADLCIVNTCTVTNEGDAKSRQAIRRIARENPDAKIVVMGCYATRDPGRLAALPGVSEVVTDKRELPDLLGRFGVIDIPNGISRFAGRHRAYVKVQDGCLLRCSFCVIPMVRPVMSSRPMEHVLAEVRRLVGNGYREIVLTGIHLGHYGVDQNVSRPKSEWTRLADLVKGIVQLKGDFRVRLSSIEATEVTRELISMMADHADRVCPHLHVCVQSGSDAVLRRMRRRWGRRRLVDRCHLVRDVLDQPALTTDVIVGFPGETDSDFEQTCHAATEVGFSKIHIFPFSPRTGTPAAGFDDQVPPEVKAARRKHLAELELQLRRQYFRELVGRDLCVLVEAPDPDRTQHVTGTACRYAPVSLAGDDCLHGKLVNVRVHDVENDRILAVPACSAVG